MLTLQYFVLSHQEWWTHLWLNEGFASWIEYLCVDHCFPEFDIWTQFVNQDLGRALELDALHTSHPIEVLLCLI
jgi:puromycin-sensitive aminopeptidase